jgi:hypothetical protein
MWHVLQKSICHTFQSTWHVLQKSTWHSKKHVARDSKKARGTSLQKSHGTLVKARGTSSKKARGTIVKSTLHAEKHVAHSSKARYTPKSTWHICQKHVTRRKARDTLVNGLLVRKQQTCQIHFRTIPVRSKTHKETAVLTELSEISFFSFFHTAFFRWYS